MAPLVEWYHSSNVKVMGSNTAVRTVIFVVVVVVVVVVVSGLFVIASIAFVTARIMSFFIQSSYIISPLYSRVIFSRDQH